LSFNLDHINRAVLFIRGQSSNEPLLFLRRDQLMDSDSSHMSFLFVFTHTRGE